MLRIVAVVGVLLLSLAAHAGAAEPLGVFGQTLARFAPDTLQPVGSSVRVGEPHAPGVLSPDGRRLAMGVSEPHPAGQGPRIGLWIVDPSTLEVLDRVPTGIAAEAVAFPGVVVALLQNGALVVVDPATGAITRRTQLGFDSSCMVTEAAAFGGGGAFVLRGPDALVRLAVVDARARLRLAPLPRLHSRGCARLGLTVDGGARRAFVVGDGGRTAVVDLRRLRVRYRDVRPLPRACPRGRTCSQRWSAVWVRGRGLAVAGAATWGARWAPFGAHGAVRDRHAAELMQTSDGAILAFGDGVRRYAPSGARRWAAQRGRAIDRALVAGGRAYVRAGLSDTYAVLDLRTGRVRGSIAATQGTFWLVDQPRVSR